MTFAPELLFLLSYSWSVFALSLLRLLLLLLLLLLVVVVAVALFCFSPAGGFLVPAIGNFEPVSESCYLFRLLLLKLLRVLPVLRLCCPCATSNQPNSCLQ